MSDKNTSQSIIMLMVLLTSLLVPQITGNVFAETSESEDEQENPLTEAGLTLIALRNDTLDTNQDGDIDSVRVVVVMSTNDNFVNLELRLFGEHKGQQVVETQLMSFSGQSNASLTYDSWANGEHELSLAVINEAGEEITTFELPTYLIETSLENA
jgi:dTDP-4-dehydrorhamnose reductase